jgi:signal transduction histidine kinase
MASDLNASRDALVESERQAALGSLVPVVAHNIRNPLASIRAGAQLIDAGDDRDELHQTRDEIIESVDRLERWVSALLSYLHPLQPHLADTSLAVVVDGALAPLKPKLDDKSIRIERRGWQHSPSCSVDSDLLEQAIYGLLNNAVDASPAESSIALAVRADRDTAVLTIDDHGPGIAFDPNPHDLTPGPSTKRFGTGLGIPFAFKICQAHGGQIEINPRASGGTRALLRLPLSPRERAS